MTQPSDDAHHDGHTPFGLKLFGIYFLFYAVYIGLSAFRSDIMGQDVMFGLKLSILYGFGLIALAILLALIYLTFAGRWSRKDLH